jgi:hypothetical protein
VLALNIPFIGGAWLMQVPKAPKLWWSIAAYYGLLFLVGTGIQSGTSDDRNILDLLKSGLLLPILGTMGFMAPFIEGDWLSWALTVFAIGGLVLAGIKLTGWARWVAVMSLIVCITAYGLYLAVTAGA